MIAFERRLTTLCLATSAVTFLLGAADLAGASHLQAPKTTRELFETGVFLLTISALVYGNLVYHVTRLGQLRRVAGHRSAERAAIEALYDRPTPPRLTVLVPSYKEERRIVLQTLLSASLAECPARRVVLLLDDPPDGPDADRAALLETRRLVQELNGRFQAISARLADACGPGAEPTGAKAPAADDEARRLAALYDLAADFIEGLGAGFETGSAPAFAHVDRLFLAAVIRAPASAHRRRAAALRQAAETPPARLAHERRRLASLFACEITSFERKLYENLSHQSNKAMNLNSYIGLMGRRFRTVGHRLGRPMLVECGPEGADLTIPDADYVLTLDADSIVLPDYILKLLHVMEADGRVAVAQTPYTAIPHAPGTLERVAGATTDIQYLVHQGFTAFGATFWVGANALLRVSALRDIAVLAEERGHRIPVFIQDKTVIEDTGSTIDLARKGWRLFNYPERLSYSATPPDFGALIVQRRRWANGGLIIFPDLLRLAFRRRGARPRAVEFWLRAHYLLSPALANLSLLVLLVYPFNSQLFSAWLVATGLPYYLLFGRDLKRTGYCWRDLSRVYALTVLLMPVNLAGVFASVRQIVTRRKSAFGRTPKVEGRTVMAPAYVVALWGLLALALAAVVLNVIWQRYSFAGFWAFNAGFMLYGLGAFIGWRVAFQDLRTGLQAPTRAPRVPPPREDRRALVEEAPREPRRLRTIEDGAPVR